MVSQACNSIRGQLLEYFGAQTEILSLGNTCVISLPIKTVDNRWVEVYIDERMEGYYVVHDAGKTISELTSHGVKITSGQLTTLNQIAGTFRAAVEDDGTFVLGCKRDELREAIFAISQCASLGMLEAMKHRPVIEDEPMVRLAGDALAEWSDGKGKLQRRISVRGESAQHKLDFVFFPRRNGQHRTIAVSVITPSYTPMIAAKLYGFMAVDIEKVPAYADWKRLAVLSKKDHWASDAIDLIDQHAAYTIQVDSGHGGANIKDPIMKAMDNLEKAA